MNDFTLTPEERERMVANSQRMMVNHMTRSMARFARKYLDPKRDLNRECGFPTTGEITPDDYREMFDRSGYGNRVVSAWADEAWKVTPVIYEDDINEVSTPFEESWAEVCSNLSPEGESFFDSLASFDIWHYLREAQIHSGIGHFGCILLGIDDGRELHEPVAGFRDNALKPFVWPSEDKRRELKYMRVFDETHVKILKWETNQRSPRYGMPVLYQFTIHKTDYWNTTPQYSDTVKVHWSRVVHVNDGKGSNILFSPPRQLPVWNNLLSLQKVVAGSAEMFWKGAFMGFALTLMNGYEVDDNAAAKEDVQDAMEKFQNGLQRYLGIPGWDIKELSPQIVDPNPHANVQVDEICVCLKMPKMVFLGSERGEQAGTQNSLNWNERVNGFRNDTCTPCYIVPLINRLIMCRVLNKPKQGIKAEWPMSEQISIKDQAERDRKRVQMCQMYVMAGLVYLIPPEVFVLEFLKVEKHKADLWIDKINKAWLEEKADSTIQIQSDPSEEEDEDENEEGGEGTSTREGKNDYNQRRYAEQGRNPLPSSKPAPRPENS